METQVISLTGKAPRSIELSDAVFGLPVNEGVIYYAVINELANARVGTASTKDRGEVHGTNRKPFAQKGGGRARHGDFKANIFCRRWDHLWSEAKRLFLLASAKRKAAFPKDHSQQEGPRRSCFGSRRFYCRSGKLRSASPSWAGYRYKAP